jgi:hypothetical protein
MSAGGAPDPGTLTAPPYAIGAAIPTVPPGPPSFGPETPAPGSLPLGGSTPVAAVERPTSTRRRQESLVSGPLLTILVAIVIVLVLAVLGIVAGQAIGR